MSDNHGSDNMTSKEPSNSNCNDTENETTSPSSSRNVSQPQSNNALSTGTNCGNSLFPQPKLSPTSSLPHPLHLQQQQHDLKQKTPTLHLSIPKTPTVEPISTLDTPHSLTGISKLNENTTITATQAKQQVFSPFDLSPPNAGSLFGFTSTSNSPKRNNSLSSHKSLSPLKRSGSVRSTYSNNSSSAGSPVIHSVTCLPSPVVFDGIIHVGGGASDNVSGDSENRSTYHETVPLSWHNASHANVAKQESLLAGNASPNSGNSSTAHGNSSSVSVSNHNLLHPSGSTINFNSNQSHNHDHNCNYNHSNLSFEYASQKSTHLEEPAINRNEAKERSNSMELEDTPQPLNSVIIKRKKDCTLHYQQQQQSPFQGQGQGQSQGEVKQQKRFFSTPLPKDSNLLSTVLHNDSKMASGIINDSSIKRESHNDVNNLHAAKDNFTTSPKKRNITLASQNNASTQIATIGVESQTGDQTIDRTPNQVAKVQHTGVVTDPNVEKFDKLYYGHDLQSRFRCWKFKKVLGKGSFSTVVLGELVSDVTAKENLPNGLPPTHENSINGSAYIAAQPEDSEDNFTTTLQQLQLVAVKITDLPTITTNKNSQSRPQDRATRARIESSLQRELDILITCHHPCIIQVLGSGISQEHYNVTMLKYCCGGDLFELASKYRPQIRPFLLRRLFSELVSAVNYLHKQFIVHRDIKLENVLVNIEAEKLLSLEEGHLIAMKNHHDFISDPIITLTDFGLSRKIEPSNVMLQTRCGSEDYVAPELLMGLPYDGRQTDTWALGVLLYALMEGRLPFDPPPPTINPITGAIRNTRVRSRTAHRIARIEWAWYFFKEENSNSNYDNNSEANTTSTTNPNNKMIDISNSNSNRNCAVNNNASKTSDSNTTGSANVGDNDNTVPNSPVINHYQYKYDSKFWEEPKTIVKNALIKRDKRWKAETILGTNWCFNALPEQLRVNLD